VSLQCRPWGQGRRGRSDSGEAGGGAGRESGRNGDGVHLGSVGGRNLGGMSPASFRSGAGRRWPRAAPMPAMLGRRSRVRGRRGSRDIKGGVEVVVR
jgi:hypothetical protein